MENNFTFTEGEYTPCIVCNHIINDNRSILFACHDKEDSMWQFLCDQEHTEDDIDAISLKEVTQIDPSVNKISDLPEGYGAERASKNDNWETFELED